MEAYRVCVTRDEPSCEYCHEFTGVARRPEIDGYLGSGTRLSIDGSIALFPSVSPLAVGHTLLAPLRHTMSLQLASADEQQRIGSSFRRLSDVAWPNKGHLRLFEHG